MCSGYLVEKEHSTKPSYEWTSNDVAIERFGSYAPDATAGLEGGHSLGTLRSKLIRVLRKEDSPTLCYVERDRSGLNRFQPVFRYSLIENRLSVHIVGQLLVMAQKQIIPRSPFRIAAPRDIFVFCQEAKCQQDQLLSHLHGDGSRGVYELTLGKQSKVKHMSINPKLLKDRGSDRLLGKLRGNAVGSQYVLYDGGLAPEKTVSPSMLRQELGLIQFNFDSFGPGTIQVSNESVLPSHRTMN